MKSKRQFKDFSVGDYLNFEEIYTSKDFDQFSDISGDKNSLHHDYEYSKETEFKEPIVPLHLSIAPFSRIAGMYMPGLPSLYLGHKISALRPVFYNQKTNYSAKIISINSEYRILTIRVLISQNNVIKVVGTLTVKSTQSYWYQENKILIKNDNDISYVLITGATGEIGKSIAIRLASMGYNLLLHSRGDETKIKNLKEIISKYKCKFKVLIADLEKNDELEKIKNQILEIGDNLSTIVHTASSPYNSDLNNLVNTNYKTLKSLVNSSLDSLLKRQMGRIIYISSIYLYHPIQGFEDYIAAKAMTTSYLSNLNKFFSNFNIISKSILPTVIDTPFSKESNDINKLIPEEVAEKVIEMIRSDNTNSLVMDISQVTEGNFEFSPFLSSNKKLIKEDLKGVNNNDNLPSTYSDKSKLNEIQKLDNLIRSVLNIQHEKDLNGAEYGITPGWDSMAQFQLVAEIEEIFSISFTSYQLEHATSYKALKEIIFN